MSLSIEAKRKLIYLGSAAATSACSLTEAGKIGGLITLGIIVVGGIGFYIWYQNQPEIQTHRDLDRSQKEYQKELGSSRLGEPDTQELLNKGWTVSEINEAADSGNYREISKDL